MNRHASADWRHWICGRSIVRRLVQKGLKVRCLCRNPEALRWAESPGITCAGRSARRGETLHRAGRRDTAYHAALAASDEGRAPHCGGLAHGDELSPHVRSRLQVGNILRTTGMAVIEFRASIVIGSGSAYFEIIRALF